MDLPRGGEDEAAAVAEGGGPRGGEAGAQRRRRRRHVCLAARVSPPTLPTSIRLFARAALLRRTATLLLTLPSGYSPTNSWGAW